MTVTKKQVLETITQALEYHEMMRIEKSSDIKAINRWCGLYNEINSYLKKNLK